MIVYEKSGHRSDTFCGGEVVVRGRNPDTGERVVGRLSAAAFDRLTADEIGRLLTVRGVVMPADSYLVLFAATPQLETEED